MKIAILADEKLCTQSLINFAIKNSEFNISEIISNNNPQLYPILYNYCEMNHIKLTIINYNENDLEAKGSIIGKRSDGTLYNHNANYMTAHDIMVACDGCIILCDFLTPDNIVRIFKNMCVDNNKLRYIIHMNNYHMDIIRGNPQKKNVKYV